MEVKLPHLPGGRKRVSLGVEILFLVEPGGTDTGLGSIFKRIGSKNNLSIKMFDIYFYPSLMHPPLSNLCKTIKKIDQLCTFALCRIISFF